MDRYSQDYQVKYYDVDARNDLKISNLLDLILEVSNQQTIEFGVSAADLLKLGYGWVVTQYHIDITRLPKLDEQITIQTQTTGYNRFFSYRDFWVKDKEGNDLVYVQSIWIIMDLNTRKMVSLDNKIGEKTHAPLLKKVPKFPRLKISDIEEEGLKNHIHYYDIDANHHVHNSHYFEWMIDQLPLEVLKEYQINQIDIKFTNEVIYGDEPVSKIRLEQVDDDNLNTLHIIDNKNQKAAEAIFGWTK